MLAQDFSFFVQVFKLDCFDALVFFAEFQLGNLEGFALVETLQLDAEFVELGGADGGELGFQLELLGELGGDCLLGLGFLVDTAAGCCRRGRVCSFKPSSMPLSVSARSICLP